jgi:hypothetical protein
MYAVYQSRTGIAYVLVTADLTKALSRAGEISGFVWDIDKALWAD